MRFVKDESGATAIEHGLIAAGIAVAIITAVNAVGTDLSGLFGSPASSLLLPPAAKLTETKLGPAPRRKQGWTKSHFTVSRPRTTPRVLIIPGA